MERQEARKARFKERGLGYRFAVCVRAFSRRQFLDEQFLLEHPEFRREDSANQFGI